MPFSEELRARLEPAVAEIIGRYPKPRSAVMPLLHLLQSEEGYVSNDAIRYVAQRLAVTETEVTGVASFYSMLETRPVGRNNVAICTNVSCWLNGADDLVKHCEQKLGIKLGESTADGRVYLKREEECIAACASAPAMTVNGHYHERLSIQKIDEILDGLK